MKDLTRETPAEFVAFLKREGIRRFYFVYDSDSKRVVASHEQLEPLARFIGGDPRDFDGHEGVFFQMSRKHDTLLGAFVHRTNRGQAAGGVRYWSYKTVEDFLRDGLRLARGMTHKNALAGLWWGGGKGVMVHNEKVDKNDPEIRRALYREYGEFMTSLQGCYVTAEDVGTCVEDMHNIFSKTRFTTCIPPEVGGSGNPSVPTARGVVAGMEAALEFLGQGTLEGKTVAVQGMGHVAEPLLGYLFERKVKKIIASDICEATIESARSKFQGCNLETKLASYGDNAILAEECDILSPCATGAILSQETIPTIRAKIICGAANNQLQDHDRDDAAIFNRGIVYVPDFLTNRMGIVNCADEAYGYVNDDPAFERHLNRDWEHSIHQTTLRVLRESKDQGTPPSRIAIGQADKLSLENHPVTGHRGKLIIRSLVENTWHTLADR